MDSAEESPGGLSETSPSEAGSQDLAGPELQSCRPARWCSAIPEFEYPAAIAVRNTFIHANIGRAPSLDGFYEERHLRSCPASVIDEAPNVAATPCTSVCSTAEGAAMYTMWAGSRAEPPALLPAAMLQAAPRVQASAAPQLLPQNSPVVLELSRMLEAAAPRSSDVPSAGSAQHCQGTCRPCAHAHSRRGCRNGASCLFCHLCPPGELKRQQKAKRQARQGPAGSPAA